MQKHRSLFEKLQRFGQMDDFSCFFTERAAFCNFLLQCSSKSQNMVVLSESCKLTKSMIFLCSFTRRRTFGNFFLESSSKLKTHCSLFQKLHSFGQINDFSCCFTKWGTFCNFFPKSWSKCKDMVVCSKKLRSFGQIDDFSCFSTEWGTFFNFLLKSSWKCQDMVVSSKSWKSWPNGWFFVLFHEMRHFLQLFPEKFIEMQSDGSLFEKLQSFGQMDYFSCFFRNWGTFCNLLQLYAENFIETPNFEKLQVFKIDDFSCEKFIETPKHCSLLEKVA